MDGKWARVETSLHTCTWHIETAWVANGSEYRDFLSFHKWQTETVWVKKSARAETYCHLINSEEGHGYSRVVGELRTRD